MSEILLFISLSGICVCLLVFLCRSESKKTKYNDFEDDETSSDDDDDDSEFVTVDDAPSLTQGPATMRFGSDLARRLHSQVEHSKGSGGIGSFGDSKSVSRPSRKRLLIVTINYTGTEFELDGCNNDGTNLKRALRNEAFDEVLVLSDAATSRVKPTRKAIIEAMRWLVHGSRDGDSLYMHYSGHGSYKRDKSGDEVDKRDETIVPLDFRQTSQILDDEIYENLVVPISNLDVYLMCTFDCCHSGTGCDLQYTYSVASTSITRRRNKKRHKAIRARVCFISGCSDEQTSADVGVKGTAYGAFTHAYLKSIATAASERMTYRSLLLDIHRCLEKSSFVQRPEMSTGEKIDLDSPFSITYTPPSGSRSEESSTRNVEKEKKKKKKKKKKKTKTKRDKTRFSYVRVPLDQVGQFLRTFQ
jgi:hypothetical protein